jgi:hypothetical protein
MCFEKFFSDDGVKRDCLHDFKYASFI